MAAPDAQDMVLSYTRVRMALGGLGMLLPVVLAFGSLFEAAGLAPSISDFYHTVYRDVFVGTMIAIGVFLVSYRGYAPTSNEWIRDGLLATIAGIGAFGTALFPNELPPDVIAALSEANKLTGADPTTVMQRLVGVSNSPYFHYFFATVFFGALATFCFAKFARFSKTPGRRLTYQLCGWFIIGTMAAALAASIIRNGFGDSWAAQKVADIRLIFWLEAFGIWAFGLSWLVKAKADYALAQTAVRLRNAIRGD